MTEFGVSFNNQTTSGLTLVGPQGLKHNPVSGTATVTAESTDSSAYFDTRAPAANGQGLLMRTNTVTRWLVGTDAKPEASGNAGTNLAIFRFANNGAPLGAVLTISRATGLVSVTGHPTEPLGVATKQYADGKVVDSMAGAPSASSAPSQRAIKDYVDAKMIVSDDPASGTHPAGTVWIEY